MLIQIIVYLLLIIFIRNKNQDGIFNKIRIQTDLDGNHTF
jgi:hypothetical protein